MSVDIVVDRKVLIRVITLHVIMSPEDESGEVKGEEEKVEDEEPEERAEAKAEERERSLEALKEAVLRAVDEAMEEAVRMRGRGRVIRIALADELGRIRREVRKAVDGATASIAAIDLSTLREGLRGRTNTLMTRVRDQDLDRMDLLVEAGLFESRSECAAFLIHAGLDARRDLVDKVQDTAKRIAELKDQLKRELSGEGAKT